MSYGRPLKGMALGDQKLFTLGNLGSRPNPANAVFETADGPEGAILLLGRTEGIHLPADSPQERRSNQRALTVNAPMGKMNRSRPRVQNVSVICRRRRSSGTHYLPQIASLYSLGCRTSWANRYSHKSAAHAGMASHAATRVGASSRSESPSVTARPPKTQA